MNHYIYPQMPNRAYYGTPLFDQLDKDKRYVAEIKRNGWRCLAIKRNGKLELWTRHKTLVNQTKNSKLEGVKASLQFMPNDSMLDGELLDRRTKDIKDIYYAFDLLWWDGNAIWSEPFWKRRKLLESVLQLTPNLIMPDQFRIGRGFVYLNAIQAGDEGIVFKRLDSPYMISSIQCQTNPTWIKIKKDEKHFVKEGLWTNTEQGCTTS